MQTILNCGENKDYVICTGKLTSLLDFIKTTYSKLDLNWENHVFIDEGLKRKNEISKSIGNPLPLEKDLKWKATLSVDEIINKLLENKIKDQKLY